MKKSVLILLSLSLIIFIPSFSSAQSENDNEYEEDVPEETPLFSIARLLIAGSIEEREPVGIVNEFASSTEKVYCFLDAENIKEDTSVTFVWYHGDTEMARVELLLGKGSRWRTYSSKKLGGLTGDWKVELQDPSGNVLDSVEFTVE